jgi:hypothetical protein
VHESTFFIGAPKSIQFICNLLDDGRVNNFEREIRIRVGRRGVALGWRVGGGVQHHTKYQSNELMDPRELIT